MLFVTRIIKLLTMFEKSLFFFVIPVPSVSNGYPVTNATVAAPAVAAHYLDGVPFVLSSQCSMGNEQVQQWSFCFLTIILVEHKGPGIQAFLDIRRNKSK